MSTGIQDKIRNIFGVADYVCGGHGARRPSHGTFTVPGGITIKFYVQDTEGLPNSVGQQVDQILAGGTAPAAVETFAGGANCRNYHLYSSKSGGYLNLGASSAANYKYITTTDKDNGISLESICKHVLTQSAAATIHWSACRSAEADGDSFGWSKPKYSAKLKRLGGR